MKRANEYSKEDLDEILIYQIDFERKFGKIEDLETAETNLSAFLLKNEEKNEKIEKPKNSLGSKMKLNNKKRKHKEIENEVDNDDETMEPKVTKKKEGPKQFKDSKYFFKQSEILLKVNSRNTVFLKNFPLEFEENDLISLFSNVSSL